MQKEETVFEEKQPQDNSPPPSNVRDSSLHSPSLAKVSPEVRNKLEHEAIIESAKEELKQRRQQSERISNLVSRGHVYLYRTSSIFPFDLFPDEISIEPDQVNICVNSFFQTGRSFSIPIKHIAEIYLYTTPFFATLRVIDKSFIENSVEISFLRKSEAEKARKIIQGLILASKEEVDLSKIEPAKLVKDAEKIGNMQGITT